LAICKDTNNGSLWVLNDETENAEITSRELFGFNVGTFQEVLSGPPMSRFTQFNMIMVSTFTNMIMISPWDIAI